MAILEKDKFGLKCVLCGEALKSGGRVCNACYDAMRKGTYAARKGR